MPRLLPVLCLALAAFAPRLALADTPRRAVVVLDRGRAAESQAQFLGKRAIRLVAALQRRGIDALLLAAGADARGTTSTIRPQPTLAGIASLGKREAFRFTRPTDARAALAAAVQADADDRPLDVYLLGPFAAPARGASDRPVTTWNEQAPKGSRVLPLGLVAQARAALADARGLETRGWLVLGFEKPTAATDPYSALGDPTERNVPLKARVHVAPEILRIDGAGPTPDLLAVKTDLASDRLTTHVIESLHRITLERALRDGRTATVSFKAREVENVHWLCEAPGPLTFEWDRLQPGARVLGPNAEAAPAFRAPDAQANEPVSVALRIVRSRVGPAPAWQGPATLPAGLTWTVGPEVRISDEVGESELRVTYRARPATPVEESGTLVLRAEGVPEPLRVPFALRVGPGRGTLDAAADLRAVVPRASKDAPLSLRIRADNGNLPATLRLRAACETEHGAWLLAHVLAADGSSRRWDLERPLGVPVGVALHVAFEVRPGAPELAWPCTLTISPVPHEGVELTGNARFEIRMRTPRLVLDGTAPALVVGKGGVSARQPLVLRLDPDGGDGQWLLDLLAREPRVARSEGGVEGWEVVGREAGTWHVLPSGAWTGATPKVFDDGHAVERIWIAWDGGGAPEAIELPVAIPARWGSKGWLFVGLAVLAVALGLGTFVMMRPPPLTGTLLYTAANLPGTVGRLDLSPAGRKAMGIAADVRGRLALGSAGALVARLRPTRVGAMIEVPEEGGAAERRLLVDGISLRAGAHMLRYVSGQPGEAEAQAAMESVPDLLGPEFDIESGRIESLDT